MLIVTSDHGEGMGEHHLFDHGESLYRTEIHVPLVIVLPVSQRAMGVVADREPRNLPATVLDLVGLRDGSPFPGRSLAVLWSDPSSRASPAPRGRSSPNCLDPIPATRMVDVRRRGAVP